MIHVELDALCGGGHRGFSRGCGDTYAEHFVRKDGKTGCGAVKYVQCGDSESCNHRGYHNLVCPCKGFVVVRMETYIVP